MSESLGCAASSLAAAEPLGATATEAANWLLVEVRGAWGSDAVADSPLAPAVRGVLQAFPGKVVFVRRPDRRSGVTVIRASAAEHGGTADGHELEALADVSSVDLERGDPIAGPIVLVCAHGRRDACCARLGLPLFEGLRPYLPADRLWQSSHLGGHRFAPNLLVLPSGIQLGRIAVERASDVAALLAEDRIPLDLYRGRTLYPSQVQAAEILIRSVGGLDGLTDLSLLSHEGELVTFSTPSGERAARIERQPGPLVQASCGADPEPSSFWVARLESAA